MYLNPLITLRHYKDIFFAVDYNNQELWRLDKMSYDLLKLFESSSADGGMKIVYGQYSKKDYDEFIDFCCQKSILLKSFQDLKPFLGKRRRITLKLSKKIDEFSLNNIFPASAEIVLTTQCNLRCIHCSVTQGNQNKHCIYLNENSCKKALDELKDLGCIMVTFTGGEPLLHKDFIEILRYANKLKFNIMILSNLTLINPLFFETLHECTGVSDIQVSIYSDNEDVNNKILGRNVSISKLKDIILTFKKMHVRVRLACVVMDENCSDFYTVKHLAKELNVLYGFWFHVYATMAHDNCTTVHQLNKCELQRIFSEYRDIEDLNGNQRADDLLCSGFSNRLAINAAGDVYPCILFPYTLGNIHKDLLQDLWNISDFACKLRKMKMRDMESCSDCKYKKRCKNCVGINFIENGDFLKPSSSRCTITELQYEKRN